LVKKRAIESVFIGHTIIKKEVCTMVNTGKVTNVVSEGNKTIVDIAFMDKTTKTVVLQDEDINKYKDKYVICGIDSDNNTKILEIVGDDLE
jgi:hypothetical protein